MATFIYRGMSKEELMHLHALLSQFEDLLARKEIPYNWECDSAKIVREVAMLVERNV